MNQRLSEALIEAIRKHADADALVFAGEEPLTFAGWGRAGRRLMEGLRRRVGPGTTVALWTGSARRVHVGMLACMMGGFDVALVPRRRGADARYMFDTVGATTVVGERPDEGDAVELRGLQFLDIAELEAGDGGAEAVPSPRDGRGARIYLYTSGTTGKPKAVVFDEVTLLDAYLRCAVHLGYGPGRRVAGVSPVPFAMALYASVSGLLVGSAAVRPETIRPTRLIESIETHRVTHLVLPPFMIGLLVKEIGERPELSRALATLETLAYGGSPMPPAVARRAKQLLDCSLVHVLASTEGGVMCVLQDEEHDRMFDPAAPGVCVGRPAEGLEVRLLDEAGNEVPDGTPGELVVRGRGVALGYRPESSEAFKDGWYYSSDMLVKREGFMYAVGRADEMLKIAGEKVYPVELDNLLRTHPMVEDAACFAMDDEVRGKKLGALVVPAGPVGVSDLRRHCKKYVQAAKVPGDVWFGPGIPYHGAGKVNRNTVREMCLGTERGAGS